MTTYTEARYNRLQHQVEEFGFTLHELDTEDANPRAVYRLDPAEARPAVIVYALDSTFRVVTDRWELVLHLDVPASITRATLEAAANEL